ncbi:L-type lectin-domain containing receptor kinase IV.1-like [Ziziphus jujuba]|uniref:non-specific serine/threonine protein kinase n=1 Tax=Ziziphus jujuba TaxID=326968 RepID=A0ABM4ABJ4_ZIZJJ|nr:L-type lectin-domain containing receptor kinase IV.1-like [Ziziphus jujuba]
MFSKLMMLYFFLTHTIAAVENLSFTYNGFKSANLSLDGIASFTPNGLLRITNDTRQQKGHAFYPNPVAFKNSTNGTAFSFSTTFVFGIRSVPTLSGHGIVFVLAPTRGLPGALASQFLGLFNPSNNGKATNHVVAVELDTIYSSEFGDINDNHVGIDINGLRSVKSAPAGYYTDNNGRFRNLTLVSRQPKQVWVEYDGEKKQMNVSLAPINAGKPRIPLLSLNQDLSQIVRKTMYVGFSSSSGSVLTSHYILGWSFKMNGKAQELVLSQLPKLPRIRSQKDRSIFLISVLPLISESIIVFAILGVFYLIKRKRKFAELVEDWEVDYGPQRYKYKDLYIATKGFRDEQLLGSGGFGRVYKGILPKSNSEIAVKRVSHESRQGMREFVAEIVSIGRFRHRNLVALLGYCRRKGELLLVYDYMPNGSLDKYLYDHQETILNWTQRFRIIKGVASGLLYLHEEWEQVVVHRDVKASNVLLDGEFNGRLGDFGLARLYDRGTDPQTTHIVGTLGYLAPEHMRTGKATTGTDVFAFGAFLLEVACGRRPIEPRRPSTEDMILVDRVFSCWKETDILEARDPNLGWEFIAEEVELVLKLGLMCSHSEPAARPTMRQVVQYLEGGVAADLPNLDLLGIRSSALAFAHREGFDDVLAMSCPSSVDKASLLYTSSSVAASLLSGAR